MSSGDILSQEFPPIRAQFKEIPSEETSLYGGEKLLQESFLSPDLMGGKRYVAVSAAVPLTISFQFLKQSRASRAQLHRN